MWFIRSKGEWNVYLENLREQAKASGEQSRRFG
jgi:hypothetical protein